MTSLKMFLFGFELTCIQSIRIAHPRPAILLLVLTQTERRMPGPTGSPSSSRTLGQVQCHSPRSCSCLQSQLCLSPPDPIAEIGHHLAIDPTNPSHRRPADTTLCRCISVLLRPIRQRPCVAEVTNTELAANDESPHLEVVATVTRDVDVGVHWAVKCGAGKPAIGHGELLRLEANTDVDTRIEPRPRHLRACRSGARQGKEKPSDSQRRSTSHAVPIRQAGNLREL